MAIDTDTYKEAGLLVLAAIGVPALVASASNYFVNSFSKVEDSYRVVSEMTGPVGHQSYIQFSDNSSQLLDQNWFRTKVSHDIDGDGLVDRIIDHGFTRNAPKDVYVRAESLDNELFEAYDALHAEYAQKVSELQ